MPNERNLYTELVEQNGETCDGDGAATELLQVVTHRSPPAHRHRWDYQQDESRSDNGLVC